MLWDKCKVKRVWWSISLLFKKSVNTVNNGTDNVVDIPESSCTVVNSDVNNKNVLSTSNYFLLPEKAYHPSKDFVFPKTKFESWSPYSCQHNWFNNYPWLNYGIEKRLCSLFLLHEERMKTDCREKQRTSLHIS